MITSTQTYFEVPLSGNPVCLEYMRTAGAKLKPGSSRVGARGAAKRANARPAKPALNAREITLLRSSFARIERQSGIAALVFYRSLFTLAPSLRALFRSDIELQGR
jgi:hypothetical protein